MLDEIDLSIKLDKSTYKRIMRDLSHRLFAVQKGSWDAGIPVVILFEGWDAAGKGASIQRLTRPIDPRGYKLYSIRAARTYEKKRPWLWRFWLKLPARGEWAIYDRSWYGRVMLERVENLIPEKKWRRAYRDIRDFERTLADDGYLIIKFFLHISKQEQKRRLEELSKDLHKAWQVTAEDWEHHRHYGEWLLAYEEAFERTDTEWGPWTIVEATDRRHTRVKIYKTIILALEDKLGLPHEFLSNTQKPEIIAVEETSTQATVLEGNDVSPELVISEVVEGEDDGERKSETRAVGAFKAEKDAANSEALGDRGPAQERDLPC